MVIAMTKSPRSSKIVVETDPKKALQTTPGWLEPLLWRITEAQPVGCEDLGSLEYQSPRVSKPSIWWYVFYDILSYSIYYYVCIVFN